jgi:hypothetical protein
MPARASPRPCEDAPPGCERESDPCLPIVQAFRAPTRKAEGASLAARERLPVAGHPKNRTGQGRKSGSKIITSQCDTCNFGVRLLRSGRHFCFGGRETNEGSTQHAAYLGCGAAPSIPTTKHSRAVHAVAGRPHLNVFPNDFIRGLNSKSDNP